MNLIKSFLYALCGVGHSIRYERNFRIHMVAMATVVIFANIYNLPHSQYPPLILCITLVMSLETVNTAIERAVDLESPNRHPLAKIAKDSAAAGVLVGAIGSVSIAVITFSDITKLLSAIEYFKTPSHLIGLIIYIVVAAVFVFVPEIIQSKDKENKI